MFLNYSGIFLYIRMAKIKKIAPLRDADRQITYGAATQSGLFALQNSLAVSYKLHATAAAVD